jgi:hypothetical protein
MKSRKMRWAGHAARMRLKRSSYNVYVWKAQWKRYGSRWENTIKMDLKEKGLEAVDLFRLLQGGANAELLLIL